VAVKLRNVARWCALAGLAAALAGAAPALSAIVDRDGRLPVCTPGSPSTAPPTVPAGPDSPGACRAAGNILESGVGIARPGESGFTPSGYHHLGANTGGEWSGVSGRISVVDGSVRPGTYDFVAGRFMVKRDLGGGDIAWLEAGWAETGWAGSGRQHVYTFNTNTKTWQFYDQYALRPGDQAWIDLHSDSDGVWGAWLWWNNRWNLLTAQKLPIGSSAFVEQYVEVHVDSSRPARIDVPAVLVDNVQLRPPEGGPSRFWRADVPTLTGGDPGQQQRNGGFCLNWLTLYDTWTAGDCPAGPDPGGLGGGLLTPATPNAAPSGDAAVVSPATDPSPSAATVVTTPSPAVSPDGSEAADPAGDPGTAGPSPGADDQSPGPAQARDRGSRSLLGDLLGGR
jgi:hypothetical protein